MSINIWSLADGLYCTKELRAETEVAKVPEGGWSGDGDQERDPLEEDDWQGG